MKDLITQIFNIDSTEKFNSVALEVFKIQSSNSPVYREFLENLEINPSIINNIKDIPFLPVEFFKERDIILEGKSVQKIFTSSATSGMIPARHLVADLSIYEESFIRAFTHFYGDPKEWTILALLPSYLERDGSSLVYMADKLLKLTEDINSGFYLYNFDELFITLEKQKASKKKTLLLGVSFALKDFCQQYSLDYPDLIIMETGGMKGRGEEIPREELHSIFCQSFNTKHIHSEYGMAELLSQSYSSGEGLFFSPSWKKIIIRDVANPLKHLANNQIGGISIIDLANINSCSFIQTMDLGIKETEDSFKVLGRIQNSEIRGCNLLLD